MKTLKDGSFMTSQHDRHPRTAPTIISSYMFLNLLLLRNSHSRADFSSQGRLAWHLSLSHPHTQFNESITLMIIGAFMLVHASI